MWSKTFIALFLGCFLSISIMLNLNYMLTMTVDEKLLIGLLFAFPIWVTAMVLVYAAESTKQALKRCGIPFTISAVINVIYFMG